MREFFKSLPLIALAAGGFGLIGYLVYLDHAAKVACIEAGKTVIQSSCVELPPIKSGSPNDR